MTVVGCDIEGHQRGLAVSAGYAYYTPGCASDDTPCSTRAYSDEAGIHPLLGGTSPTIQD